MGRGYAKKWRIPLLFYNRTDSGGPWIKPEQAMHHLVSPRSSSLGTNT